MSHNNDSGKFFKFKNLQLVRKPNTVRQTRQNTDLNTHGTAEEQFAAITATARADALREIDNISSHDESVDYSPPEQLPLEPTASVRDNGQQISDSDETNKSTPEIATDSSLDTLSIEVIQPNEALAIKLPHNPPQRAPPNSPESPRTNVAVSTPQDLFTEDEDTEDDDVPPTTTTVTAEVKGRKETLSPIPQVSQTVRSAIEVTAKDFDPSEQRIVDKCGEVDFQLSNHRDWQQPNPRLRQDICDLLPLLYQSGFNTEGFPNLEDYLYQTVGTLPCQSLLRLALDSVFEEFPEISAIQTKVYRMLKCHLSVINHPSITQFDDISLSNHDFDRVVGPDFHNVSGAESRPDLLLQTDFNDTYYSVFSQAQRQVYRVTERSLSKLRKDRANSCPDIVQQLHRETDRLANSKWTNISFTTPVYPDQYRYRNDQQTQTDIQDVLQVKDTGAQYSSPSDTNESSSSDFDSDIEGTENITVTRRPINRRSASSEDLYSNPTPPHKRFRTSTPEPYIRQPENEPIRCLLKEIINHRPALQIPPIDLTVAPGRRAANVQLGRQRVNTMAGRGRNQPQPLQGADPALVQILQMMQNRDANRDNSRKQFLMFPKECFTGQDKKLAKSHWAEFSKYLDYQNQQGTLLRDLAHLPEIKSMFKLTLQDIALGWFETESPTWLTEDQMKQSFLKRFNPWGDTRRQQQDAWNKLKFDMTKDDVDSFVVDMKTLASILGHNDEIIMEKFKDVFPDPNIEAALIAMDDFALMQKKAKQLVHIYKPAHDNPMASATILVHTAENTAEKGKSSKPKSNQHQLAPINQPQTSDNNGPGDNNYNGGQRGRGRGSYRGSRGCGNNGNSNRYDNQERGPGRGQGQRDSNYSRGRGHDNSYRGRGRQWDGNDSNNRDRDNRDRNYDGQGNSNRGRRWDNNSRGQGHSDRGRGRRWNPSQQYHAPGYHQEPQFQDPNHYRPPPMGHQYRYPVPYGQYPYQSQQQQYSSQMPTPSQQAANICQLCYSQGHYDYQCQFAGDFMARTQKAFNQGRSYSHQDPNNGEWSQGDGDNNDPNGQPFQ